MSESNVPLVSVKMITYNHEKYIAKAIEGVVNQQTNFPFELIIGTDCSPDKTDEIVAEYAAKYPDIIKVCSVEKNTGAFLNGKRVDAVCRGKYLAYCEGDDYWHDPNKLQMQVDIMEKDPQVGLVHSDINGVIEATGRFIPCLLGRAGLYKQRYNKNPIEYLLTGQALIRTCSVCCRRDLLEKSLQIFPEFFDVRFRIGDMQRFLALATMCKFHYIEKPLATYNMLDESASRTNDPAKNRRFLENVDQLHEIIMDKLNIVASVRKKVISKECHWHLSSAYQASDAEYAKKQIIRLKESGCHITFFQWVCYWGAVRPELKTYLKIYMVFRKFKARFIIELNLLMYKLRRVL